MNITLNIKKGLDLNIAGAIADHTPFNPDKVNPIYVAITPDDFPGLILKPSVKEGDHVVAGMPLLHDKNNDSIKVVSPAGGVVTSIVRGDRRKLERVIVKVDERQNSPMTFDSQSILTSQQACELLQASGLWAMIRQRPYNIVACCGVTPRDIFVSALDTSPLAPDLGIILKDREEDLEAGVKLLTLITSGEVYIGRRPGAIPDIAGATMVDVTGPHPAGNTGVIAANIKPVNKGETVWTLDGITLARIGNLVRTGRLDTSCTVALTGSEVINPHYINTTIGADISTLITGKLASTSHHQRIISGNALSGVIADKSLFLRYPYTHITVIPEGDDVVEFMGWASISLNKMSTNRSFPGHFFKKIFKPDARLLGGRRAMIMSGEYDKVVPMDIMTEYLIKAILAKDIEKMESLGIYEVAPEDFSVAEYVCTSKMPLQTIVADGLNYLRKELE